MSLVTCHLSLTPTAIARDPPPAFSPTMHSRLVCKDPNMSKGMPILAILSLTRSLYFNPTPSVLACAFIPLLKNSLKDLGRMDSYRAVAGSSLLLKIFEWCILIVCGAKMNSDSLQFGFKKKCSTGTATWLVFLNKKNTCDRWHVSRDTWHMTHDIWHIVWDEHALKISAL